MTHYRTALDTNIVSGLWSNSDQAHIIEMALLRCRAQGSIILSPVVATELMANPDMTQELLDRFLARSGIEVTYELSKKTWMLAGTRFARHAARRRRAMRVGPRRLAADFLIGAHAVTYADRLMTLDTTVYEQDFPELPLYPITLT